MIASIFRFVSKYPDCSSSFGLDLATGRVSREGLVGFLIWITQESDLGEHLLRLGSSAQGFGALCRDPSVLTQAILEFQPSYGSFQDDAAALTPLLPGLVGELIARTGDSKPTPGSNKSKRKQSSWWDQYSRFVSERFLPSLRFAPSSTDSSVPDLFPPMDMNQVCRDDSEAILAHRSILDAVHLTSKATAKHLTRPAYTSTTPDGSAATPMDRLDLAHVMPSLPSTIVSGLIQYVSSLTPQYFSTLSRKTSSIIWNELVAFTFSLGIADPDQDPIRPYLLSTIPNSFSVYAVEQLIESCKFLPASAWRSVGLTGSSRTTKSSPTFPSESGSGVSATPLASQDLLTGILASGASNRDLLIKGYVRSGGEMSLRDISVASCSADLYNVISVLTAYLSSPFVALLLNSSEGEEAVAKSASGRIMRNDTRSLINLCRFVTGDGRGLISGFVPSTKPCPDASLFSKDTSSFIKGALGSMVTSILTSERDRIEDFIAEAVAKAYHAVQKIKDFGS